MSEQVTSDERVVDYASTDGVVTLTLNSPNNRNALSHRLLTQLVLGLQQAAADPAARCVVLAANGPAWCSGADLAEAGRLAQGLELDGGHPDGPPVGPQGLVEVQRRIMALDLPVVARVHAAARAGGLGLLGAADIVLAAESVTFAFTEARLGLAPMVISLTTLPRMTSRAASETFLTTRTFDAVEAARIGLITRAVPDAELDSALDDVTSRLAKASRSGLRESKRLLNEATIADIDARGQDLLMRSAQLFVSDEAQEAMRAFFASRQR